MEQYVKLTVVTAISGWSYLRGKSVIIDRFQFWTVFYTKMLERRQAWKGIWSNDRQMRHATEA